MYKENYNKIHKREIDYIARFHVYGFVHNKENSQQKRGKKNAVRRNSEAADKRSGNGGDQPGHHKNQQQGCDGGNADTYYLFGVQLLFFHLICHLKSTPLDVLLNYTIIIRFKQGKYFKKTEKSFSLIR